MVDIEKYQIQVDGATFNCDGLGYEYEQLDSEGSGRSEDGAMYRDVIGITNKVYCTFQYVGGTNLTTLLQLIKKTSCSINYFDPIDNARVTKNMYIVADQINVQLINGDFVAENVEIRFINMNVDGVS